MANVVKDLMKRRVLLRVPSEDDGRAYGLKLSDQGKSLVRKMNARARRLDLRQTRNLTNEEREILLVLLKKLLRKDGD